MAHPRTRARVFVVALLSVLSSLTAVAGATAGERLVFDALIGTALPGFPGSALPPDYGIPSAIAIDLRGFIYVADPRHNRVLLYDGSSSTPTSLTTLTNASGGSVTLNFPVGVAVDPRNEDVWITNTNAHQLVKIDKNGQLLTSFGSQGNLPDQFQAPLFVGVDGGGNVYVADNAGLGSVIFDGANGQGTTAVRVQKFRSDGTFVRTWGSFCAFGPPIGSRCNANAPGAMAVGDGQFEIILGMAVDRAGNVYVSDSQDRIQKFDTDGVLRRKWGTRGGGDGQFNFAGGIAVDFAGNVYVTDSNNDRIQKFDSSGQFLSKEGSPGPVSVTEPGVGTFNGPISIAAVPREVVALCFLLGLSCQKLVIGEAGFPSPPRVIQMEVKDDADGDGLLAEVDVDPALASTDFRVGLTVGRIPAGASNFVMSAPTPQGPSPRPLFRPRVEDDTVRIATGYGVSAEELALDIEWSCMNSTLTTFLKVFNATTVQAHCSTPTLDVLTGQADLTFTAPDGTMATASLDGGDGVVLLQATSGIQATTGSPTVVIGGSSVTLAPGQTAFADTTPPATNASRAPAANANGWSNANVTATLTAADNAGGSGVKEIQFSLGGAQSGGATVNAATATVPVSSEGLTTLSYFARDKAGNQEATKSLTVQIDTTLPTATFGAPSPAANATGWNNTDVSIAFTTSDAVSGVDASNTTASPVTLTTEGSAVTAAITVTDRAGNTAMFTSPPVKIDKTPPTVACVRVAPPRHDDEKALFRVAASDTLSQVAGISLGGVSLAQGEIIQLQSTKKTGIRLVGNTDDDRDDPRFKRFKVGPGAAVIKATDAAGNVGTAVCPLPPRHDDDDDDHGKPDGKKGRDRD